MTAVKPGDLLGLDFDGLVKILQRALGLANLHPTVVPREIRFCVSGIFSKPIALNLQISFGIASEQLMFCKKFFRSFG